MPEQLNRSKPPRDLDLYTQLVVLFGGFSATFGWIFFGFGMIFFWGFGMNSTAVDWFKFGGGDWENTQGIVQAVHGSNFSENEEEVNKVRYTYKVGGLDYYGTSYETGTYLKSGDAVQVEYKEHKPKRSRVEGLRSQPFSGWLFPFVMLFPAIGLGFIYYSLRQNTKALDLLKNGRFALGDLMSRVDTKGSITIDGETFPIYRYKFQFEAYGQKYISKCRTHLAHLVEDDDREIILFDPYEPERSVVYDAIEYVPALDGYGNMSPISPKKAWVLIAPLLSIVGYGLTAFVWFVL